MNIISVSLKHHSVDVCQSHVPRAMRSSGVHYNSSKRRYPIYQRKKKKQCNPGTISHSYHKNRIKARVVQHSLNNSLGAWGLLSSSAYNSVLRTYRVYSSLDTSQILILVHLSWLRSYPPSNMHACPEYVLCTVQPTERPVLTDQ